VRDEGRIGRGIWRVEDGDGGLKGLGMLRDGRVWSSEFHQDQLRGTIPMQGPWDLGGIPCVAKNLIPPKTSIFAGGEAVREGTSLRAVSSAHTPILATRTCIPPRPKVPRTPSGRVYVGGNVSFQYFECAQIY